MALVHGSVHVFVGDRRGRRGDERRLDPAPLRGADDARDHPFRRKARDHLPGIVRGERDSRRAPGKRVALGGPRSNDAGGHRGIPDFPCRDFPLAVLHGREVRAEDVGTRHGRSVRTEDADASGRLGLRPRGRRGRPRRIVLPGDRLAHGRLCGRLLLVARGLRQGERDLVLVHGDLGLRAVASAVSHRGCDHGVRDRPHLARTEPSLAVRLVPMEQRVPQAPGSSRRNGDLRARSDRSIGELDRPGDGALPGQLDGQGGSTLLRRRGAEADLVALDVPVRLHVEATTRRSQRTHEGLALRVRPPGARPVGFPLPSSTTVTRAQWDGGTRSVSTIGSAGVPSRSSPSISAPPALRVRKR